LLMGLALVVHLPLLAHDLFQRLAPPTPAAVDPPPENDWWAFVRWMTPHFADSMGNRLLYELFTRLTAAMVIFAVYERILKRQPSFRSCLRGGWRRRGPVLAAALLLFLIELPVLAFLNLTIFYMAFQNVLTPWFWELLILGTLVFLGVMVPFWVAVPAAVVERSDRWLRRSWSLTKGRRIRILAITATMFALEFGAERLVDESIGTLGRWGHFAAALGRAPRRRVAVRGPRRSSATARFGSRRRPSTSCSSRTCSDERVRARLLVHELDRGVRVPVQAAVDRAAAACGLEQLAVVVGEGRGQPDRELQADDAAVRVGGHLLRHAKAHRGDVESARFGRDGDDRRDAGGERGSDEVRGREALALAVVVGGRVRDQLRAGRPVDRAHAQVPLVASLDRDDVFAHAADYADQRYCS